MEWIIETGDEALKRQMDTLLSTRAGSVPVSREFGISWDCLDAPPEVAESLFYQELLRKTEKYVPEVKIRQVVFASDTDGSLTARIQCERRMGNE